MSNIPLARSLIKRALGLMTREGADFRAPTESRHLTETDKRRIRALRRKGLSQRQIASKFNTNTGRISEIVNGKR